MEVQVIDDADSRVKYSTGWQKGGSSNENMNSTSGTGQAGATATLAFVGVQIEVFGTIGPQITGSVSPRSNYTIDGVPPATYTPTQNQNVFYKILFYRSPMLPLGPHTLVVTNIVNSSPLYLDYFYIQQPPSSSNVIIVTSTLSPTLSTTSRQTSQTSSLSPSSSSSSSSRPSSSPTPSASDVPSPSNTNTAAVVGSVFGAFLLIFMAAGFIWWHRGRKKRRMDNIMDNIIYPQPTHKDLSPDLAQPPVLNDNTSLYQDPMADHGYTRYPDIAQRNAQSAFPVTQQQMPSQETGHRTAHHHNGHNTFAVEAPSALPYRNGPYDPHGAY